MKITEKTVVTRKEDGKKWLLYPTEHEGILYLSSFDGMDPIGQIIHQETADKLFEVDGK